MNTTAPTVGAPVGMGVPVAMGLAVLGAIISGIAFCCGASRTRNKQTLKQLMAVEGVGSGAAVIARTEHKYVPDSEGPGENYYYAWYSWTAQHANGGAFFRVKVDKQSIDDKTFGKLQQGAQVPVRFLEAEPRKFILQMEAEHQMAAKSDAQVDRNERSKINSFGCFIMSFGAVVGLGFSLGQGVDGAKLAGLGAYLFVLLGIGVFAACCANPNAAFPCCPGAEYKCAGITIAVEELAPPPTAAPDIRTMERLMAADGGYAREDALSSLLASKGEEAKALEWLRQHCQGGHRPPTHA